MSLITISLSPTFRLTSGLLEHSGRRDLVTDATVRETMTSTEDRDKELWRSWLAGYEAGGRNWRSGSKMKCPYGYDKGTYESGAERHRALKLWRPAAIDTAS
jgi:hypothetical protein